LILPTKHLRLDQSLLAAAAAVLVTLRSPLTVSATWERVRDSEAIATFDRFALALDLLFALGLVSLDSGRLRRAEP
jgi:ABC-three component (ABC-3C) system Middle Component 6